MAAVGSYVLSLREREAKDEIDIPTAAADLLKRLGKRPEPASLGELLSLTGLPEAHLVQVIDYLRQRGLVEGDYNKLSLTQLGYQAQFIVAT